jgi:hypothetical protein
MVSTGRRPAGYACASAFADRTRSAAAQGFAGPVGVGDGVGDLLGDGLGEDVPLGRVVAGGVVWGTVADADGDGDCLRAAGRLGPDVQDRATSTSATTRTPNVSSRRRQYTAGGSGPRGWMRASESMSR